MSSARKSETRPVPELRRDSAAPTFEHYGPGVEVAGNRNLFQRDGERDWGMAE